MKTSIILISGQQGSGKSTLANQLVNHRFHVDEGCLAVEIRFADLLYVMHNFCRDLMKGQGFDLPEKNGRLLQLLGTEWGRNEIDQDVWVKSVRSQILRMKNDFANTFKHLVIVISDCRFRNEFDAFPDATRVRLECDEATRKSRAEGWRETTGHLSEIDLDSYAKENHFDMYFDTSKISPQEIAKELLNFCRGQ